MNEDQGLWELESCFVATDDDAQIDSDGDYCHPSSDSYRNASYTTSPAPNIGGDCNALDQRALVDHALPQMDMNSSPESMKRKIKELRLCLQESAMEYEIKVLEMKINMLQNKSQHPKTGSESMHGQLNSEKVELAIRDISDKSDTRCLDYHRDQLFKLRREKGALTEELIELRKKERQFDLQRRNLHDAVQRVRWLQRELSKKEELIVDCQSKEKKAKARLQEVQIGLQNAQSARNENMQLSNLIPSLINWFQSLKKIEAVKRDPRRVLKIQQYEASLGKILEEWLPQNGGEIQPRHVQQCEVSPEDILEDNQTSGGAQNHIRGPSIGRLEPQAGKIPNAQVETKHEVEALQRELEKLACLR